MQPLLVCAGYALVRARISGPELTIYLEQSGISPRGVRQIYRYIGCYNENIDQKKVYFEPRGEVINELSEEHKMSLLKACGDFYESLKKEAPKEQKIMAANKVEDN